MSPVPPSTPVALAPPTRPADRSGFPVALVSMPFVEHFVPSIQLGLLKAIGAEHGFAVTTYPFFLDFARRVGTTRSRVLCNAGQSLKVTAWLFSVAAFGDEAPDPGGTLLARDPEGTATFLARLGLSADGLRELRDVGVPAYLDALMREVDWGRYAVVGFSSTYEQSVASFALARRIKQRHPDVVTLFGGANFDDEMGLELVRAIDCIDYAVVGEGDDAFPAFLTALADGHDPAAVRGVTCRRNGTVVDPDPAPLLRALDRLPFPDHTEWFTRAQQLGLFGAGAEEDAAAVVIPFESARGCWWGQKHHCTFCGLNGTGMAFRSKSAARVRAELDHAAARYPTTRFSAVDNIIDMAYLRDLLPGLAADGAPHELHYEVKANLTRAQISLLRAAGVRWIQPGIESFSSHVLRLIRKGVTALQNVNTLRWALHHGLDVAWNVLYGFPGETSEDYRDQERVLHLIPHLPPPQNAHPAVIDRFSPMFTDRAAFPVEYLRPPEAYRYVYPSRMDLARLTYTFDHAFTERLPATEYAGTQRLVTAWQAAWRRVRPPTMTFRRHDDVLLVADFRDPAAPTEFSLTEPTASAYLAISDRPTTAARVAAGLGLDPGELADTLDGLCDDGLVLREGDAFLALALPEPGR